MYVGVPFSKALGKLSVERAMVILDDMLSNVYHSFAVRDNNAARGKVPRVGIPTQITEKEMYKQMVDRCDGLPV